MNGKATLIDSFNLLNKIAITLKRNNGGKDGVIGSGSIAKGSIASTAHGEQSAIATDRRRMPPHGDGVLQVGI